MELWYWTFPTLSGRWTVVPTKSGELGCGSQRIMPVRWDGTSPVLEDGTRGTRWEEGKAVQQGVLVEDAWASQVGGRHYADMVIQPFQFSMDNGLDPMQHTIIKYVARFRSKNGIQDLEKAKHTIDLLIAWEAGQNEKRTSK